VFRIFFFFSILFPVYKCSGPSFISSKLKQPACSHIFSIGRVSPLKIVLLEPFNMIFADICIFVGKNAYFQRIIPRNFVGLKHLFHKLYVVGHLCLPGKLWTRNRNASHYVSSLPPRISSKELSLISFFL